MKLPQNFLDEMKELLGDEYEAFLASYDEAPRPGLRIHTGKLAACQAPEKLPWELMKIPWIENGYYYGEDTVPSRHPYYFAGLYYLQEPSAMTPASLLPVTPGERVLDMCAAPGGKATELGVRLKGEGVLFANDISNSRAKALLKNLEIFGIPNIMVTSEEPSRLLSAYPEYFDKILVDAPCSGEGMFRKDPKMVKSFEERGPKYYAEIQKELIVTAADMLRPGGMLLYSTCTFSRCENEEIISYLLHERENFRVLPVSDYEGFSSGIVDEKDDASLKNCVRIWPHHMGGEGHFAALLKKDGPDSAEERRDKEKTGNIPFPDAEQFLKKTHLPLKGGSILLKGERLYQLPEGIRILPGIRYLRTGLYLGEIIKGKYFEPSQALAQSLGENDFISCVRLTADDIRTVKYLKGETLDISDISTETEKGWQLVCVDGWPLGWGKLSAGTLKNKYYSGWRWQ